MSAAIEPWMTVVVKPHPCRAFWCGGEGDAAAGWAPGSGGEGWSHAWTGWVEVLVERRRKGIFLRGLVTRPDAVAGDGVGGTGHKEGGAVLDRTTLTVVFEGELYVDVRYLVLKRTFHTMELDGGAMLGLEFASETTANAFRVGLEGVRPRNSATESHSARGAIASTTLPSGVSGPSAGRPPMPEARRASGASMPDVVGPGDDGSGGGPHVSHGSSRRGSLTQFVSGVWNWVASGAKGGSGGDGSSGWDKMEIGGIVPGSVKHEGHIGLTDDGTFDVKNIPKEWQAYFRALGVSKKELQRDPDLARSLCTILADAPSVVATREKAVQRERERVMTGIGMAPVGMPAGAPGGSGGGAGHRKAAPLPPGMHPSTPASIPKPALVVPESPGHAMPPIPVKLAPSMAGVMAPGAAHTPNTGDGGGLGEPGSGGTDPAKPDALTSSDGSSNEEAVTDVGMVQAAVVASHHSRMGTVIVHRHMPTHAAAVGDGGGVMVALAADARAPSPTLDVGAHDASSPTPPVSPAEMVRAAAPSQPPSPAGNPAPTPATSTTTTSSTGGSGAAPPTSKRTAGGVSFLDSIKGFDRTALAHASSRPTPSGSNTPSHGHAPSMLPSSAGGPGSSGDVAAGSLMDRLRLTLAAKRTAHAQAGAAPARNGEDGDGSGSDWSDVE